MSLADDHWRMLRDAFRRDLVRAGVRVRPVPDDLLERGPAHWWPLKPVPKADRA